MSTVKSTCWTSDLHIAQWAVYMSGIQVDRSLSVPSSLNHKRWQDKFLISFLVIFREKRGGREEEIHRWQRHRWEDHTREEGQSSGRGPRSRRGGSGCLNYVSVASRSVYCNASVPIRVQLSIDWLQTHIH